MFIAAKLSLTMLTAEGKQFHFQLFHSVDLYMSEMRHLQMASQSLSKSRDQTEVRVCFFDKNRRVQSVGFLTVLKVLFLIAANVRTQIIAINLLGI